MSNQSSALMAGVPELVVLRLLAEREMYGYEIARSIKLASKEALSVGEGVLYPALHAMETRRLLRARSVRVEGRTRIYYSLTARGKMRLEKLCGDWRRISQGIESILVGPAHA